VICLIGKCIPNTSAGGSIFISSFEIYKKLILAGAIIGFLLLITKIGFGIGATFNN
jgi:hypothetical protein